jgi:hypothetical protein
MELESTLKDRYRHGAHPVHFNNEPFFSSRFFYMNILNDSGIKRPISPDYPKSILPLPIRLEFTGNQKKPKKAIPERQGNIIHLIRRQVRGPGKTLGFCCCRCLPHTRCPLTGSRQRLLQN